MFGAVLATVFAAGSAGAQTVHRPATRQADRRSLAYGRHDRRRRRQPGARRACHWHAALRCQRLHDGSDHARPAAAEMVGPQPTPDEARDTVIGYSAYFGTYRVDEQARTVTHIRAGGIEPGPLADLVRRFELVGDNELILRPVKTNSESNLGTDQVMRGESSITSKVGSWTSDAAARRDCRRGQDHQMVQVGRRRGEAGRQPVRDRDRQGFDGSAVDRSRHAHRNPRRSGRGGAGRRGGCGDRGGGGAAATRSAVAAPAAARCAAEVRPQLRPLRRESRQSHGRSAPLAPAPSERRRSSSIRSSRCARPSAITGRRNLPAASR